MPNLTLAICELHIPDLHGYTNSSDKDIINHYMITNIVELDDFYNEDYKVDIAIMNECYLMWLYSYIDEVDNYNYDSDNEEELDEYLVRNNITHPNIRNYSNIIDDGKYIKLDIVEMHELNGHEMVGFIKTFWLRILQRKWKKIFKKRKEVIRKRKFLSSLKNREINGNWSNKLRSL
tara:strand:- start:1007 stop:1537 length:531 start_codon:yes stop_codon:yes gene_type:complete